MRHCYNSHFTFLQWPCLILLHATTPHASCPLHINVVDGHVCTGLQDLDAHLKPVLLCAAEILGKIDDIKVSDPYQWWLTFEVNMRAMYDVCRAVLPHMVTAKAGTIINISSCVASVTAPGLGSDYCVSKSAVAR